MDIERINKLKDQIWTTRISRTNAERRLIAKEKFVQGINIYYSCCAIFFSVWSLVNNDRSFGLMALFMTVALFSAVLYLSNQRYLISAREYRENYTKLQKLEMELEHPKTITEEKVYDIESKYCELLDSSTNHEPYDFWRTVYESNKDYKEKYMEEIPKYIWGTIWRVAIKILLIALPAPLFFICKGGI